MPIDPFATREELPETLPDSPFPLIEEWLAFATEQKVQPNPNAMTVATVGPDGQPSARIVLCRGLDVERGIVWFYTNKRSRKGRELAGNPRVALILHWDDLDRQVRIEGVATDATDAESDAYFASRGPANRIGSWASDQSEPIDSRDALMAKVMDTIMRLGIDMDRLEDVKIPRPAHWGGYRVWAHRVELWLGSSSRIHDRARWERTLTRAGDEYAAGPWSSTRLQP